MLRPQSPQDLLRCFQELLVLQLLKLRPSLTPDIGTKGQGLLNAQSDSSCWSSIYSHRSGQWFVFCPLHTHTHKIREVRLHWNEAKKGFKTKVGQTGGVRWRAWSCKCTDWQCCTHVQSFYTCFYVFPSSLLPIPFHCMHIPLSVCIVPPPLLLPWNITSPIVPLFHPILSVSKPSCLSLKLCWEFLIDHQLISGDFWSTRFVFVLVYGLPLILILFFALKRFSSR